MGYKLKRATIWQRETRLPSAYQEVERIQSDGSQWLNTGVKVTNNTKVVNKGYLADYGVLYGVGLQGSYQSMVLGEGSLKYRARVRRGASANATVTSTVDCDTTPHVFELSQGDGFWIDGTKIGTMTSYTFTETRDLYIFGWNNGSGQAGGTSSRIYYFEIYENGTIIRNLIPCYRKADSEIGMYDLANNVFYTNDGSGTFTKGNDVGPTEQQLRPSMSVPVNGLLGYRPLETDNKDLSGNGNDVTITGGNFGTVGNKAGIQLSTSYTLTPTNYITTPDLGTSTTFSFAGWLYKTTTDTSGNNDWTSFFENATADTSNAIRLRGKFNILRAAAYGNGQLDADGYTITPNTWTHYCVTSDGTTAKVYVDGQYYNSFTAGTTNTDASGIFYIGSGRGGTSNQRRCWPGWVRQFMFYDRVLTADEVLRIYTRTQ